KARLHHQARRDGPHIAGGSLMSIHWPTGKLDVEARVQAVKAAWFKGASMSDIGTRLGVTKNAIAGVYNRVPSIRETHPLRPKPAKRKQTLPSARTIKPKPVCASG